MDLDVLLGGLGTKAANILATVPTVDEMSDPALDDIPGQGSQRWLKIPDVVAVVFDLKSSTQLGTGRYDTSTARIYKAAVESSVAIASEFDAQFIDIQGDGGFALFWGNLRYERALCAAVTIRTFSAELVDRFVQKFPNGLPETGFKIGVASGRVLVKQLGMPRNVDEQEAVWAGRPVNYAAKAAQSADRHEVVVTGSVWDHFEANDYVVYSCSCNGGPTANLWKDFTIDRIPDREKSGRLLKVGWCENCGAEFCDAIRIGEIKRTDIPAAQRHRLTMTMMESAIAKKHREDRAQARRLRELSR
jgi:class 3 adenylate cyclase